MAINKQRVLVEIAGDSSSATAATKAAQNAMKNLQITLADLNRIQSSVKQQTLVVTKAYEKMGMQFDSSAIQLQNHNRILKNSNGNYKQANEGMRMMRGGAAQLGYQIQDVAVQLQMGQNALLVFGQQGSQVASIFGAKGAMLGAVLAVSAALGTALLPNLFKSANHLKDLTDRLDDAADSFDDLTNAQREYLKEVTTTNLEQARNSLQSYAKQIELAENAQQFLNNATSESSQRQVSMGMAYVGAAMQAAKSAENTAELTAEFETQKQNVEDLENTLLRLNGTYDEGAEGLEKLLNKLGEQVALLDASEAQIAEYEAINLGASEADLERVRTLSGMIEAYEAEQEAIERTNDKLQENARLRQQASAIEKAVRDMSFRTDRQMLLDEHQDSLDMLRDYYDARLEVVQSGTETERKLEIDKQNAINVASSKYLNDLEKLKAKELGVYADGAGGIAAIMKEGSSAQRAALAVQKGFAVASAVMNMHAAIGQANAAAPFPANLPAIAMALSQGLSAVAGVRGVSFEGGGFTGMGARSGGIDGRGGFPAILHPNETVYDHTKGQGMGVNVSFNISTVNAQGFDELLYSRRGQIINMINQAVNNSGRRSIT